MADAPRMAIILVEDDPNDAELAMRVMRKLRLAGAVRLVKDGADALEVLFGPGRAEPAVVFLDLKMPRVDGLDVLRRLRTEPRTRDLPVVILTGSREEHDQKNSHALGVTRYLTKPLTVAQVEAVLTDLRIPRP